MRDVAWLLGCAGLVFLMQPGFLCLEAGLTRSKNSINVAVKNLSDFGLAVLLFWLCGFGLMFGATAAGWWGTNDFVLDVEQSPQVAAFFLFQAMFCGTATTIVSGAVAERLRFEGYVLISVVVSGLMYPVFGHWAWNGLGTANLTGWLGRLGFVDFAGGTVVHGMGAWVSLAALLIIGPRIGRFDAQGRSHKINGSNLPFSMLGAMLLWLGWFGFNGGSSLTLDDTVPRIIAHTVISGVAGLLAGGIVAWQWYRLPDVEALINGSLAGLVAITPCCHAVTTPQAALIGAIGAVLMLYGNRWLERRGIDDAVGAVAIHGFSGAWGTIAVGIFGNLALLGTGHDRLSQLAVQALGIGVAFAWAFGITSLILRITNRHWPLRVSPEDEILGLNVSEHQAKTELYDLFAVMDQHARTEALSARVPVEPYTEVGYIAQRYNQVMDALEEKSQDLVQFNTQLEHMVRDRTEELHQANQELQRLDRVKDEFLANTSHELRTPLNGMIGLAEAIIEGTVGAVTAQQRDFLESIIASGRRLTKLVGDILDAAKGRQQTLVLQPTAVDLPSTVAAVLPLHQAQAAAQGVELVSTLPTQLPLVWADRDRLQQILHNLIGNALKFCPAGSVTVTATVQPEIPQWVWIAVRDTGIGIATERQAAVFEAFEQADGSTAREYGGTGLGLAIAKQLVELHGGTITLASAPDQGSTFTFSLPVARSTQIHSLHPLAIADPEEQPAAPTLAMPAPPARPSRPQGATWEGSQAGDQAASPPLVRSTTVPTGPESASFESVILAPTGLESASPESASPESASPESASPESASPESASLAPTSLESASFAAASLESASFEAASLVPTSLESASFEAASLAPTSLARASLAPLSSEGSTAGRSPQPASADVPSPAATVARPLPSHPPSSMQASLRNLAAQRQGRSGQIRILVVDDEPINQKVLIAHLNPKIYDVVTASNGPEALQIVENGFKPDLVLMDVMMPKMTGYEVTQRLRERYPATELPIVMLTAKNQIEDIVQGLESGANDYVAKPVSRQELHARLQTHLKLSNLTLAYSRFVPHEFLELLEKDSILDVRLGDQVEREMAVLFADIRSFTTLSEQMTPSENFRFINAYLSRMEPAIAAHHGFIDKFIGDAIMALFPGGADDAVQAAIAMQQALHTYNQERQQVDRLPIQIGIGINAGPLRLGTVGGQNRMNGTAISDAVNLASRIETLTKRYQTPLLISHHALAAMSNPAQFAIRFIDRDSVKGRQQPVAVFEILDGLSEQERILKTAGRTEFEAAILLYHAGSYGEAAEALSDYVHRYPADLTAQFYLQRATQQAMKPSF